MDRSIILGKRIRTPDYGNSGKSNLVVMTSRGTIFLFFFISFYGCGPQPATLQVKPKDENDSLVKSYLAQKAKQEIKMIHVYVALCDNKYQGIVPVPDRIGNGQDAENNLYWGAVYGVKSFFSRKDSDWRLVKADKNISDTILERVLFKHKTENIYLLADAYNGKYIKEATIGFLNSSAGADSVHIENKKNRFYFGGLSDLIVYIGHNGLMDFSLSQKFAEKNKSNREAIILACYGKKYFSPYLQETGSKPLIWSTGLMAPEAYILHNALKSWVKKESAEQTRKAAALAYSKYQKCSLKAAENLLVSGW